MKRFLLAAALATFLFPVTASADQKLAMSGGEVMIFGGMSSDTQGFAVNGVYTWEDRGPAVKLETRIVPYAGVLPPGSVLVKTHARELYFILPNGKAILYPVGVGREGFTWSGEDTVSKKAEWPDWRPPKQMIEREYMNGKIIPAFMPGGPNNPLGARALYIGNTQFRIHGTTQPWSIGRAASSGCIRMLNEHVIDLYDRVAIGARVIVE